MNGQRGEQTKRFVASLQMAQHNTKRKCYGNKLDGLYFQLEV